MLQANIEVYVGMSELNDLVHRGDHAATSSGQAEAAFSPDQENLSSFDCLRRHWRQLPEAVVGPRFPRSTRGNEGP
jgi:hypothetical protein